MSEKTGVQAASEERLRLAAGRYLEEAARVLAHTASHEVERVARVSAVLTERLRRGGKLFTCGNGGSAADAQHVAAELSGKFYIVRPGLAALCLNTNVSALTAIGNDFDFAEIFVRPLSGLGARGDVLMGFTTSGRSPNVRRAMEWAREQGLVTVAFTGEAGREWAERCDHAFVVASSDTPHIQQAHITLGHAICALVEAELFGPHGVPPEPRGSAGASGASGR